MIVVACEPSNPDSKRPVAVVAVIVEVDNSVPAASPSPAIAVVLIVIAAVTAIANRLFFIVGIAVVNSNILFVCLFIFYFPIY